ncbi:MAG: hypothetical protein LBE36_09895 [Flavobacteriaceae bacterium]|nr:hypothetical protein [Flavobacteriaceae bacterium]
MSENKSEEFADSLKNRKKDNEAKSAGKPKVSPIPLKKIKMTEANLNL